ncbi:WecB/TagA/CpsF family glycosyltransferase [Pseudomonas stutzeri]|uniref:WecB/TagA/CpsF family glycosyltransferase n=1 Tax=Pseudomonas TaxID=286 RepID=UPI00051D1FA3|nr:MULTISPECIES: WecB/TagA/CpsF family glycosyltransferase [Pseudomonas]KGK81039.1 N-acetyl-mannosamine transferase [Stutzerimonas degradans]MCQ4235066.1 WecB/TagA/CpsF family glycosyltransferase [Stutzerimonas degradans]OOE13434.1 glycosyltransferase [Stutzerimonas degradans]QCT96098.1 WecB/TagA/CpsF family glycosyltransferase [Stutzerimonas degradans]QGW22581.1 WecB/TagA/CpsF family glycosyltransferase [Stutzerimonas degradans]
MSNDTNHAFGVSFYTGSKAALLAAVREGVKQPYSFVVTPNVDHLAQLQHNAALRAAYSKARLRLCDSRVLMPLLQRLGVAVEEVIPGSDLTIDLLRWADSERLRIVLVGASNEECTKLRNLYPGITVYHHNPPMGFIDRPDEVRRCLEFIRQHPSELVFYAVGAPRQEILASSIESHERTGMGFCIGASISFATGSIKRAPRWMQNCKLEWLHRMLSEPRRLVRRYVHDALFIVPAYRREKSNRTQRAAPINQDL